MGEETNIFKGVRNNSHHEEAPPTDFEAFKTVVKSRRSVRVYENEAVPDEIVMECLRLALLAPNSSNLQPWEFYWVDSPDLKPKLAKLCFGQPAATTAPVLIVCVARPKLWRRHSQMMLEHLKSLPEVPKAAVYYYSKLAPFVYNQGPFGIYAPFKWLLFTLMGFFRLVPRDPFGRKGMKLWASKSVALACENLMLAFRAAGYDSCPMEGFDEFRVKGLLKLPGDAHICMIVSAGKRKRGGIYGAQIRFDEKLFIKKL